jgi:hypothetical protein
VFVRTTLGYINIYSDNFFSPDKLTNILFGKLTYAHGTAQGERKDWQRGFTNPKSKKLKRCESRKLKHKDFTAIA